MKTASYVSVIKPNIIILSIITALAYVSTSAAQIDGSALPMDYVIPATCIAIVAILIWIALDVIAMAINGVTNPVQELRSRLAARTELLLLPVLIQPLFFAAFTAAKTSIAPLMSFTWDHVFTDIDAAIFFGDPWRLTHAAIGPAGSQVLEFFYTMVWGSFLVFTQAFIAIYGTRRAAGTFFLALNLTWLIGGIVLAYMTPAAGPIFAHLFDPALGERFADLRLSLLSRLQPDGAIIQMQNYLAAALGSKVAEEGGGISAMPSMHVATAMLYVLAARGTRWFWSAVAFAVLTCIGSVHFGYHYALDGLVAILVAGLCWRGAELWFAKASITTAHMPEIAVESV